MMDPSLALGYDSPELDAAKRLFLMNQNNAQDTTIAKPNAVAIPTKDVDDNIAYARMMATLASGNPLENDEFSDDSQENESSKIKTSGKGTNDNMTSTEVKTGMASNKSQANNHPQSAEVSKEGVANAAASTLDTFIKSGSIQRKDPDNSNHSPSSSNEGIEDTGNVPSTEGVEDIGNSEIIGYVSKVIGHETRKGVTSYLCEWEPTELDDGTVKKVGTKRIT